MLRMNDEPTCHGSIAEDGRGPRLAGGRRRHARDNGRSARGASSVRRSGWTLLLVVVALLAACRAPASIERFSAGDGVTDATAASETAADGAVGATIIVVREAFDQIAGQLFREVSPNELLGPAWQAIAAEARHQGMRDDEISRYQARGDRDIEGFTRELSQYLAGPGRALDPAPLGPAAVRAMAAAVGDSHTRFLTPQQQRQQQDSADGDLSYVGIGVRLGAIGGAATIADVYPDSPADRAGLRAGDRIVGVDGQDLATISLNDVSSRVRGPEGTEVRLTVQRPEEGMLDFTVNRTRVSVPIVSSRMIDGEIGYIAISSFPRKSANMDAAREFDEQLARLVARGARGLVLDLRFNPGGDPFASVAVASNFVPDGPIFISANRAGRRTVYPAVSRPTRFSGPVAVLVNRGTASGAEVVASALSEYGAGYVIGTRTCGCLSVGMPLQLGDTSGLMVTVEQAFTGRRERSLEGVGLAPDDVVSTTSGQRDIAEARATSYLRNKLR